MTHEKSCRTWGAGFRGYKHPTSSKLTDERWVAVKAKVINITRGNKTISHDVLLLKIE